MCKFFLRCTWPKQCDKEVLKNFSCGLCLTDDSVLIYVMEIQRCFLLPLRRIDGSCKYFFRVCT